MAETEPAVPSAWQKYKGLFVSFISQVRSLCYKSLISDIIVFVFIIAAFELISIGYQMQDKVESFIGIGIEGEKGAARVTGLVGAWLLIARVVALAIRKRAQRPPPKKQEWEIQQEMKLNQKSAKQTPAPPAETPSQTNLPSSSTSIPQALPTNITESPPVSLHQTIQQSLRCGVPLFLLFLSVASYGYFFQPRAKTHFFTVDQAVFLGLCGLVAHVFYVFGKVMVWATKIDGWQSLGIAFAVIIGLMTIGIALNINMFIFI